MATDVQIPDFEFAAFYYADLLDALIAYKRQYVPEHTDESEFDPLIQMLRSFALVGHLNNVLLDVVANESTLPTAKLPEQVRNMLRLIDYKMESASPSTVDEVFELSKVFAASFEVVPELSQLSTEGTPEIRFEALAALTTQRTDEFGTVFAYDEGTDTYTDYTAEANNPAGGNDFTPWAAPAVGDALYFGHPQAMWDELEIVLNTIGADITGVWEFYDARFKTGRPDSGGVSIPAPGTLRLNINDYLGTTEKTGTLVRVALNETTAFEDLVSQWDGSDNYIVTTSNLGQTSPSTDADDYTVSREWQEFESATDGTSDLTASGSLVFTLPQSVTENWQLGTVNGDEAFWVRYRIVAVSAPTAPVIEYGKMDEGKQYVHRTLTQGRTQLDTELGSSDGTVNQAFETTKDYYISGTSEVYVDSELWTEVENFLASRPADKHYRVAAGENDRATIVFGDGVTGKIPPAGVGNIEADYRWSANEDGNVGANTITKDKSGLTYINSSWNPRQASGWEEAQGATEESLEQAKIDGPASLRTGDVAVGPQDVELMSTQFVSSAGSRPFSRSKAFEEGFGPKTIELIVVGQGGVQAPAADLAELEEWFNGDALAHPPLPKRVVANQEVTVVNFTAKTIDITATVYGDTTVAAVEAQLAQVFQPEALKADGVTYEWEFGEDVPVSRISHEIFETSEAIENVVVSGADVPLSARELPTLGAVSITVVSS